MSISEALFQGRVIYRRLFVTEENRDEEEQILQQPGPVIYNFDEFGGQRENTPVFSGDGQAFSVSGLSGGTLSPAKNMGEDPDPDEPVYRLIQRMENDSRMYPQDFGE